MFRAIDPKAECKAVAYEREVWDPVWFPLSDKCLNEKPRSALAFFISNLRHLEDQCSHVIVPDYGLCHMSDELYYEKHILPILEGVFFLVMRLMPEDLVAYLLRHLSAMDVVDDGNSYESESGCNVTCDGTCISTLEGSSSGSSCFALAKEELIHRIGLSDGRESYEEAHGSLREDRDVAVALLAAWPATLWRLPAALRADKRIGLFAVRRSAQNLKYASPVLREDTDVICAAVQQNGMYLRELEGSWRGHARIVKAAAANNGMSLQFASESLRSDQEIAKIAIAQNASASRFLTKSMIELEAGSGPIINDRLLAVAVHRHLRCDLH